MNYMTIHYMEGSICTTRLARARQRAGAGTRKSGQAGQQTVGRGRTTGVHAREHTGRRACTRTKRPGSRHAKPRARSAMQASAHARTGWTAGMPATASSVRAHGQTMRRGGHEREQAGRRRCRDGERGAAGGRSQYENGRGPAKAGAGGQAHVSWAPRTGRQAWHCGRAGERGAAVERARADR
jgi:hypothetical protein